MSLPPRITSLIAHPQPAPGGTGHALDRMDPSLHPDPCPDPPGKSALFGMGSSNVQVDGFDASGEP